jgi:hypothetical protein
MTPVETLLAKLSGVRKAGKSWSARCPAHDDRKASLSVSEGDDGTALVKCHAGCDTPAVVSAVGMTLADLFPPKPGPALYRNGTPKVGGRTFHTAIDALTDLERRHGKSSALWTYHDAHGEPVGLVVRWDKPDGKDIRPVARHGDRWRIGAMPDPRPLYGLPMLTAAQLVVVTEGEKAADKARSLGFTTTTSAGGSQAATKTDWSPLAGKEIWILPDNDLPGRKYADIIAGILAKLTPTPVVRVVEMPGLPKGGDIVDWIDTRGGAAEPDGLRKELEELARAGMGDTRPNPAGVPTILITTAELEVDDQAIAALASDPSLYHRGGMLVRLLTDDPGASAGIRWSTGPRIDPLPRELLRERLSAAAHWVIERGDSLIPARPPSWCVGAVMVRGQYPGLRHLYAVAEHPVLRPDGTVLTAQGYDACTGLYLASDKCMSIPDRPTLADAKAASDKLLNVVQDFPFASEAHRSAWLAALLTPLARFAFEGPAPLFLVDANVRGSGKGLLLDCICTITTGKRLTIATYTDDQDELRKRITSLAITGERMVLFDNLEGRFGNAVLDAALTAVSWEDRLPGFNRIVRAPLLMTWFSTGNNVAVHADTARRICHVRLDSSLEHPELRSDFKNPELLRHVEGRRDELLAAALTILRAYFAAGKPGQNLPPWGSFLGWSDLVRAAVVWCGLPDPAETRVQMQERSDVTAEHMGVLLASWEQLDPDRQGLTASGAIDTIKRFTDKNAAEAPVYILELKDAIEALVGRLDPRALGYKLRSYRRRNFGGKFLDVPSTCKRAARWAVFPSNEFSTGRKHPHHAPHPHPEVGEDGEHGEDDPGPTKTETEEIEGSVDVDSVDAPARETPVSKRQGGLFGNPTSDGPYRDRF